MKIPENIVFTSLFAVVLFYNFTVLADYRSEFKSPIFYAANEGNVQQLKQLLSEGIKVDYRTKDGLTALFFAASAGKLDAVKLLVKYKADVNARSNDGETPLMHAADNGRLDIVKYFVKSGADPNIYVGDKKNATAYYFAKKKGYKEVANYLASYTTSSRSGMSNCYIKSSYWVESTRTTNGYCSNNDEIIACSNPSEYQHSCTGPQGFNTATSSQEAINKACGCD